MGKVNGRRKRLSQIAISILVIICMTKNMDMANSIGKVEITILVTISMIKDMVMVRCFGTMALYT